MDPLFRHPPAVLLVTVEGPQSRMPAQDSFMIKTVSNCSQAHALRVKRISANPTCKQCITSIRYSDPDAQCALYNSVYSSKDRSYSSSRSIMLLLTVQPVQGHGLLQMHDEGCTISTITTYQPCKCHLKSLTLKTPRKATKTAEPSIPLHTSWMLPRHHKQQSNTQLQHHGYRPYTYNKT